MIPDSTPSSRPSRIPVHRAPSGPRLRPVGALPDIPELQDTLIAPALDLAYCLALSQDNALREVGAYLQDDGNDVDQELSGGRR